MKKINKAIQSEISKGYEVKIPKDINMHLIITTRNMNFKASNENVVEKLD